MKSVSIYETKSKLSQLLKLVQNGQEFVITDRGKPVARITPLPAQNAVEQRLERFRQQGILEKREKSEFGALPVKISGVVERFLKERE